MDRRTFLNLSLPVTGAIMVTPALLSAQVRKEISAQFSGDFQYGGYDLVINGGGLAGYFAAMEAAAKGLRVLLVEKRSSPGFDIAAKKKLWIDPDKPELLDEELTDLFFPEQEKREVFRSGGTGPGNSRYGDELLLLSGTVRKGMLRNLLIRKVHILLMTDVCGVFTSKDQVKGVLLACKQGLYAVSCSHLIDASDNLLFSRQLVGQDCLIDYAGFVLELLKAGPIEAKTLQAPQELGLRNHQLQLHQGKNAADQVFVEFEFPVKEMSVEQTEIRARQLCAKIGEVLPQLDPALQQAQIHQYAWECSLVLKNQSLPKHKLQQYSLLPSEGGRLTVSKIRNLRESARQAVSEIKPGYADLSGFRELRVAGATVPAKAIRFSAVDDPGLKMPLSKCIFDYKKQIKNVRGCEVLIAGGGTAGALSGIGAAENGAVTIVTDYFNDLGGTKTLGGVMGYYHGLKDHPFIKRLELESGAFAKKANASSKMGRQLFLLDRLLAFGGQFAPGALVCDVISTSNTVEGTVICSNGKLEVIHAGVTIDGTGDGDIAAFAGAAYDHGNFRNGLTQNYSQWNIQGSGKAPSAVTSDYGIIDNRFISEIQRGLFLAHYEAHFYDFHPFLTIRESRRIKGIYELTVTDAFEGTHFADVIAMASSDFDPHYTGNSEYTRSGFLLPHSNAVVVEIPYRSIVPEKLNGILITGKAFSQTQNVYQFTRMSADISVLGYVTGQIAAHLIREKVQPREFSVAGLQQEWLTAGYLPKERMSLTAGSKITDPREIKIRLEGLEKGLQQFLPACCNLPKDLVLPLLKEHFETAEGEGKLLLAKALAWFGDPSGADLIEKDLAELFRQEQEKGYPEGYVENYDFIRDRKLNILEGLYWKINQDIALLALSGSKAANGTIKNILEKTSSGGGPINWTGDRAGYFNERIDLRIIPFHNRICNLCFYIERNPDRQFISGLENLLDDKHIYSRPCQDYTKARWSVYRCDLELYIGATLARCGGQEGFLMLADYLADIHYNLKHYAQSELQALARQNYDYNQERWLGYLRKLEYPAKAVPVQRKPEA